MAVIYDQIIVDGANEADVNGAYIFEPTSPGSPRYYNTKNNNKWFRPLRAGYNNRYGIMNDPIGGGGAPANCYYVSTNPYPFFNLKDKNTILGTINLAFTAGGLGSNPLPKIECYNYGKLIATHVKPFNFNGISQIKITNAEIPNANGTYTFYEEYRVPGSLPEDPPFGNVYVNENSYTIYQDDPEGFFNIYNLGDPYLTIKYLTDLSSNPVFWVNYPGGAPSSILTKKIYPGRLIGKTFPEVKPIITYLGVTEDNQEAGMPGEYFIKIIFDKAGIRDDQILNYQIDIFNFQDNTNLEDPCLPRDLSYNGFPPSKNGTQYSYNIEFTSPPTYFQARVRAVGIKPNTYSQWSDAVSFGTPCEQ